MVLLVLWATAEAADDPCGGAGTVVTAPAADQADVPVDVRPALVFEACAGGATGEIDLWRDGSPSLVQQVFYRVDPETRVVRVPPPAPLEPRTPYRLHVRPEGGTDFDVPFTTGAGSVRSFDGIPDAEVLDDVAVWDAAAGTTSATLRIRPAADPDGLSLLTVSNETEVNVPLWAGSADAGELDVTVAWAGPRPHAQCYSVVQWDGRGDARAADLPCVDVGREGGCAGAPGPRSWALVAAGLGISVCRAARRRRGSPGGPSARAGGG